MQALPFFLNLATSLQLVLTSVVPGGQQTAITGPAAQIECAKEAWIVPPTVRGGLFSGSIQGQCHITSGSGRGLGALSERLLREAIHGATVHEGPVDEYYQGLPGVKLEVTDKLDPKEDFVMRKVVHIATDRARDLVYAMITKEIHASGLAGYVKRMDSYVTVHATESNDAYDFALTTDVVIARPWFIPSGIFKSESTKIATKRFVSARAEVVRDFAIDL